MSRLILLLAVIASFSTPLLANMRAPRYIEHGPSFSLAPPVNNPLTVRKEKLNIDCDYESCLVQAVYFLHSLTSSTLAFTFILPTDTAVEARVGGTRSPATVARDEKQTWRSPIGRSDEQPLYQATFSGLLTAGENVITVKYRQPLTLMERDYGYFTDGRFVALFSYQLKPLKEWQLADDFTLHVNFSGLRKRPDRDGGWSLLRTRTVDCMQSGQVIENDSDHLNLSLTFGHVFPDTLVCRMGDRDLLENQE